MNALTTNPTVYGIISTSPLFKVAFPDAKVITVGSSYDKDNGKDETTTAINNPHCELYPNGSVME